ncbi:MAG: methionine--tRNA ligase [Patescibacteria group bacterium]
MISLDEFKKVEIKIGKILSAERVPDSDKLILLKVDLGTETRQLVAGIGKIVENPEELASKELPVLVNLEPKMIKGYESQGMILAADNNGEPVLLHPASPVNPGSVIK